MTEIGLEIHSKKLDITRCHMYIEKGKEGEKEVEKCTTDSVEKVYKIPTVQEGFEDFIELNIPQPQRECRVFKLAIPEVICKVIFTVQYAKLLLKYFLQDITTTECSEIAFLEENVVQTELHIALPSKEPKCSPEILSQTQQVFPFYLLFINLSS